MEFIWFVFLSSIEVFGSLSLMLSVFRFNLLNYWRQVLIASVLLTLASYIFRILLGFEELVPLFLLLITILVVWLFFDIKIYYAGLMVVTGSIIYLLFQTVILYLLDIVGIFHMKEMTKPETHAGYVLQFLSGTLAIVVSSILFKKGWGFSFSFQKMKFMRQNTFDFSVVFMSILLVGFSFFCFFKGFIDFYLASIVLIVSIFCLLLILLIKREKNI